MWYPTLEHVLRIHQKAIRRYGGSAELADLGRLETVLAAVQQTVFGEDLYPDVASKAAMLAFLLVKGHPFMDGNKRTGAATMLVFLRKNGQRLQASNDELYQFVMGIAMSTLTKNAATE